MIGHWIAFSILFILIPFWIGGLKVWLDRKSGIKPTPKEERIANVNVCKYTIFYWLVDFFYMACFNDWLVCKFVFGCLLLVIIFYNLAIVFTAPKERSGLEKAGLVQDFLVGIGMTVYLLYIVPDATLQSILIPVVSAVYGGLITLVGVAWTIRKSDRDRKRDEIERSKPVFGFGMIYKEPTIQGNEKACFSPLAEDGGRGCECYVRLENSDRSSFTIKSIVHDGKEHGLECQSIIVPGNACVLSFRFDSPENIHLKVEDVLGNPYYYGMKVLTIDGAKTTSDKFLHTIREIKPSTVKEYESAIKEGKENAAN